MRITGDILGQALNLSDAKGILENINVGEMVKAKILEITASDVILKLFDGSTVKAATASNMDGKPGDAIQLVVKEKKDGQILLETVKTPTLKSSSATSQELQKQLSNLGVQVDSQNLQIAEELKTHQLPISKESIHNILDLLTKFKDLTPAKAAFLISGNLELEEKNISALTQIVEGKEKITGKLHDMVKTLGGIQDGEVLSKIEQQLTQLNQVNPSKNSFPEVTGSLPKLPIMNEDSMPLKIENTESLKVVLKDVLVEIPGKEFKTNSSIQNLAEKMGELFKNQELQSLSSEKIAKTILQNEMFMSKFSAVEQKFLGEHLGNIFQQLKNELILKGKENVSPMDPLILKSKEVIQKTLDQFVVDIRSDSLKEDLNIKNLYRDLYMKLEAMKETFNNSVLPNKNEIIQQMDQLQNQMRFMNELSSHSTYIQIPLQIWDKNTTGELYILKKNDKKKKIDPENVTVFISLEMENMGRVDSLIGVQKKNVTVQLRLEEEEVIQYIKENYKELYQRLNEKGFKLVDMKYRLLEDEANLINIKEIAAKESPIGLGTIDYRL